MGGKHFWWNLQLALFQLLPLCRCLEDWWLASVNLADTDYSGINRRFGQIWRYRLEVLADMVGYIRGFDRYGGINYRF